jgi:hypothetical protein
MNDKPYDSATHQNPWLINTNRESCILGPEGVPLTAEHIWSKSGHDREELAEWVYHHYRREFVRDSMSETDLDREFGKLRAKEAASVINADGEIINSSRLGNDICRHFVWDKYFSAKGRPGSRSVREVYDSPKLLDVVKNRMGWCLTREDGEERPYVFAITDKMILQGIRSSGLGHNVSMFKPMVAKYLLSRARKRVIDYSAGWGARCLAAMSLGLEYYGIDPNTAPELNRMMARFGGRGFVVDGCSADRESYRSMPETDCAMSCPPYFDLETYSSDRRQSIVRHPEYEGWLKEYWRATVDNCFERLCDGGVFIAVVRESLDGRDFVGDMRGECERGGLTLVEALRHKTPTSHLSRKRSTGRVSKTNEIALVFRK